MPRAGFFRRDERNHGQAGKIGRSRALPSHGHRFAASLPFMKVALDVVLFLLTGIAVSAATVGGAVVATCAVAGGGCWWWMKRRRGR